MTTYVDVILQKMLDIEDALDACPSLVSRRYLSEGGIHALHGVLVDDRYILVHE